jgi:hypothetical protein
MTPDDPREVERQELSSPGTAGHEAAKEPALPPWANKAAKGNDFSEARMQAYFGPRWEKSYKRKLAPFFDDPSFVPTWNWPAAIAFPPAWFLYRKLYVPFTVFFLVPGFVFRWLTGSDTPQTVVELSKPENQWLQIMSIAVFVSSSLAAGGTANWFLFRRARAASRLVSMQSLPESEGLELLRRMGGVNRTATSLFVVLMLVVTLMQFGG